MLLMYNPQLETFLCVVECGSFNVEPAPLCRVGNFKGTYLCGGVHSSPAAGKDSLTVQNLYGEKFMMMRREWSHYVDLLRDDLWKNHPKIQIVDFDFYDVNAFNQCENNNCVLMAVPKWQYVHPLLKILPVDWSYTIPYGLLHSPDPSPVVKQFLRAVQKETGRDK